MNSWFNTQERIAKLQIVAFSWLGTPWGQNSRVKGVGGGVSCHLLPYEILKECGFPLPFPAPNGPAGWSNHNNESLIVAGMDIRPEFAFVETSEAQSGDLLGFTVGKCVHHMGIVLPNNKFAHVWRNSGVLISTLEDPTYANRLARVWRPLP